MADFAKVALTGKLPTGKEPRQSTVNNTTVVTFGVGVYTTKKVDDKYAIDYYTVEYWGKPAEYVLPKLKPGVKVQVYGGMHMEEYNGKDGKKTYPKVRATEVIILDETNTPPKHKEEAEEEQPF
jgi:single-stranded DNA-binding protein